MSIEGEQYPGDTGAWLSVVSETYSLDSHESSYGHFYRSSEILGKSYATVAPFLTDSARFQGILEDDTNRLTAFFEELEVDYALIKSRHCDLSKISIHFDTEYNYSTFLLNLAGGPDYVWTNRVSSKTRNQTRKGLKQNALVKWGREELLADFFDVVSRAWRDLGTPTHSPLFYRNILKSFGEGAELIVIYMDNTAVSAAICLIENDTIYHPYAATLKSVRGSSINNVLYWEIIKYGCKRGLKYFDLGRSHCSQGTYRFKASWGAKAVPLFYSYWQKDHSRKLPVLDTPFYRMACAGWKRTPLWVANRLGPHLIRKVL
ncbi:GNAT family N-acetyltransferase [Puniceicoccaceae bacterium K14]|nr:GNAT family N-acetyltransferase [Puniceicoccaceae bacterium K14]